MLYRLLALWSRYPVAGLAVAGAAFIGTVAYLLQHS